MKPCTKPTPTGVVYDKKFLQNSGKIGKNSVQILDEDTFGQKKCCILQKIIKKMHNDLEFCQDFNYPEFWDKFWTFSTNILNKGKNPAISGQQTPQTLT